MWLSANTGLRKLAGSDGAPLLHLTGETRLQPLALDVPRGQVWSYGANTLKAFSFAGQLVRTVAVPAVGGGDDDNTFSPLLSVNAPTGSVWLARGTQLRHLSATGTVLHNLSVSSTIRALAFDPLTNRLWRASTTSVQAYNEQGVVVSTLTLGSNPTVRDLTIDALSGAVWVSVNGRLQRYAADGSRVVDLAVNGVTRLSSDGASGVWLATGTRLQRRSVSGAISVDVALPTSGDDDDDDSPSAVAVAADPVDHTVWLAQGATLRHYSITGQVVHTRTFGTSTFRAVVLYTDVVVPTLSFLTPAVGALLNTTRPPLTLSATDTGQGVDPSTLQLQANATAVPSTCTITPPNLTCTPGAALPQGAVALRATIADFAGNLSAPATRTVTIDSIAPVITVTTPVAGLLTKQAAQAVTGSVSEVATLTINAQAVTLAADRTFTQSLTLAEGPNTTTLRATDPTGNVGTVTVQATLDTVAPTPPPANQVTVGTPTNGQVTISGGAGSVEGGAQVRVTNSRTGASVTVTATAEGSFSAQLAAQAGDGLALVVSDGAGNDSGTTLLSVAGGLPPDPATVAPPINRTVATDIAATTAFLYTGANPIQTGVAPGTIEARRVAVLRGKVLTREGAPLSGVRASILDHPELGQTLSRPDGLFDMAVNGGGPLIVQYQKTGYLPAQRQVTTPWRDYVVASDVALIPLDPQVTTIDLTAMTSMQVAQGSAVTDSDGTRQATILFPQGTTAQMVLPDGSTQPLTTLHVRATEYTVGDNGPQAMPGDLPPSSAYTYAVELSVDEALANGKKVAGKDVLFSQPVPFYVDNFLNFPVGGTVPVGYYDNDRGAWVPWDNGRILKILSVTSATANLDTNGDNVADTAAQLGALGITPGEQQQLATLYPVGKSLWRVALTHFSTWDLNWGMAPPDSGGPPSGGGPEGDNGPDDPDPSCGSVIGCQGQTLGETLEVPGTGMNLVYQSDRTQGRTTAYTLQIPLNGGTIPGTPKRVEVEITVAGRQIRSSYVPVANQRIRFTWDGQDGYGRVGQGRQGVRVRVGNTYDAVYTQVSRFGYNGNGIPITGSATRREVTLWKDWQGQLGTWDARSQELGGWSLSAHHAYDPNGQVLYLGDGTRRSGQTPGLATVITTAAGGGDNYDWSTAIPAATAALNEPYGIAADTTGNVYIAEGYAGVVRKVAPNGLITRIAGGSYLPSTTPATQTSLSAPVSVAVDPQGNVYILDQGLQRVYKVTPQGQISTVAGTGVQGYSGDGGPATSAQLNNPQQLALDRAGNLYIADVQNNRVRRVDTAGIITTVAGDGSFGNFDGGRNGFPATQVGLWYPSGVAVDEQGNLYIADRGNRVIRKVTPNGINTIIVGFYRGADGFNGDGLVGTQTRTNSVHHLTVDREGNLYFADQGNVRVRRLGTNGLVTTVAGDGTSTYSGDRGPPLQAGIRYPHGIAITPDGALYFATHAGTATPSRVRKVAIALPGFTSEEQFLPSADGGELYVFDVNGRHLRTINPLTNAVLYTFGYDSAGRLITVTDANNNVTTIERAASGAPTAMRSPFGQRTTLTVDGNGALASLTTPAGETHQFTTTATGLLESMRTPRNHRYEFTYDPEGRLVRDADPAGGVKTLSRTGTATSYEVSLSTTLGRTTRYPVTTLATGDLRRAVVAPDGTQTTRRIGVDGRRETTRGDGTIVRHRTAPDPRFSLQAPLTTDVQVTTPGGLVSTATRTRTVTLSDPLNLLSLTTQIDETTRNGRVYTSTYTQAEKTLVQETPANRQTTTTIDSQGRVTTIEVPGLAAAQIGYDARGRVSTLSQGPRTSTWAYAPNGYLASVTDPLARVVSFERDAVGRVTRQTLPDNRVIAFTYDANGNATSLTPPGRDAHSFTFTPVNLVDGYDAPFVSGGGTNVTTYAYNLDRQLTTVTRPDGQQVVLGYDSAGRLSTQTIPTGQSVYSYHATTGNLSTLTAPGGETLSYSYDGSLPTRTTWVGPVAGSVGVTYDNNFRVTAQSVNGGQTAPFTYDLDSLLTGAGALTLNRNAQNGLLTGTSLGSVSDTITYNPFAEPSAYEATVNGSAVFRQQYTRDELGRITTKTETTQGVTDTYGYTYDLAGRLTEVKLNGLTLTTYAYDSNGNRLSKTSPSGTQSGTYDAQDRLLTYNGNTYTYTANGELASQANVQSPTPNSYQYDVLGNLLRATLVDGTQIDYVVDGQQRRVGKKVNGTLVQGFLYQNQLNPVAELDGTGAVVSRFVYASKGNVPDFLIKGGVTYRIISDHLGSPRLVVNTTTGAIVQRMDYDEFGQVITDTNPGFQPFGFAGGLYDRDTKLVRFGARDYDAETGRWTAKDPILFAGGDTNLYGYVMGDSVNLVDPNGLKTYQCRRPIGQPPGQYVNEGIINHQYTCVILADGQAVCSSITPTGGIVRPSPGRPTTPADNDVYHPEACEKVEDDNKCFEDCIQNEWNQPRPQYSASGLFGTNCWEYDDTIHAKCRAQCGL